MAEHEINFSDPGAPGVIADLQTILSLIRQIRQLGGGIGVGVGGGRGGVTGGRKRGSAGTAGLYTTTALAFGGGGQLASWSSRGGTNIPNYAWQGAGASGGGVVGRDRGAWRMHVGYPPPDWARQGQPLLSWAGKQQGRGVSEFWKNWGYGLPGLAPGADTRNANYRKFLQAFRRSVPNLKFFLGASAVAGTAATLLSQLGDLPRTIEEGADSNFKKEQRGINRAMRRMSADQQARQRDLQWQVAAEAERGVDSDYFGYNFNFNKSGFPWKWSSERVINADTTRKITEELLWRQRYFGAKDMRIPGGIAYKSSDWEKSVAQASAMAATGRVYKSPYPKQFFVRTKSGG